MSEIIIAYEHESEVEENGKAYLIDGVLYGSLKMTYLSRSHDEYLKATCNECDWSINIGDLPFDAGYVVPDVCPECQKNNELGFVRNQSPVDGSLPSGWELNE